MGVDSRGCTGSGVVVRTVASEPMSVVEDKDAPLAVRVVGASAVAACNALWMGDASKRREGALGRRCLTSVVPMPYHRPWSEVSASLKVALEPLPLSF
jgi:hypothetical protein